MKQYVVDQLRYPDYEKLKGFLDQSYGQAAMGAVYWIALDPDVLSPIQSEHRGMPAARGGGRTWGNPPVHGTAGAHPQSDSLQMHRLCHAGTARLADPPGGRHAGAVGHFSIVPYILVRGPAPWRQRRWKRVTSPSLPIGNPLVVWARTAVIMAGGAIATLFFSVMAIAVSFFSRSGNSVHRVGRAWARSPPGGERGPGGRHRHRAHRRRSFVHLHVQPPEQLRHPGAAGAPCRCSSGGWRRPSCSGSPFSDGPCAGRATSASTARIVRPRSEACSRRRKKSGKGYRS